MKIISLFAGAGGLDTGFQRYFDVIWANEYDKEIWDTYKYNHPDTFLDTRSILDIKTEEIPDDIDGIIGGPPCQSWSLGGNMGGLSDPRGKLFFEYLRILKEKQPKFFVLENVKGILSESHRKTFMNIKKKFEECGYNISYKLLNTSHYGIPQDRERVILVGYRKDLNKIFNFENLKSIERKTLKDAIGDLSEPLPALNKTKPNPNLQIANHEYMLGGFSSRYMSRNRRRNWDEPSFTIQAGGRHAPLHPEANPMIKLGQDEWIFDPDTFVPYRRLSVRECARIQTFPDTYIFIYKDLTTGYKMIGNAVPVKLGEIIAEQIHKDLC